LHFQHVSQRLGMPKVSKFLQCPPVLLPPSCCPACGPFISSLPLLYWCPLGSPFSATLCMGESGWSLAASAACRLKGGAGHSNDLLSPAGQGTALIHFLHSTATRCRCRKIAATECGCGGERGTAAGPMGHWGGMLACMRAASLPGNTCSMNDWSGQRLMRGA